MESRGELLWESGARSNLGCVQNYLDWEKMWKAEGACLFNRQATKEPFEKEKYTLRRDLGESLGGLKITMANALSR